MTLRSSDLQSDSDLESICNSCNVFQGRFSQQTKVRFYNHADLHIIMFKEVSLSLSLSLSLYNLGLNKIGILDLFDEIPGFKYEANPVLKNPRIPGFTKIPFRKSWDQKSLILLGAGRHTLPFPFLVYSCGQQCRANLLNLE